MHSVPPTKRVSVNGISLAYYEWPGKGQTLICIPSITGHKGTFAALAERLAPAYRIMSLDLRGRCDSDKPESGYGFAYHARDILGFADALQVPHFVLVGHSFGATTSVYTASLVQERIRALILLDGGADPKAETLRQMYPAIKRLTRTYSNMDEYLTVQRSVVYHKPWTDALERYLREDVEMFDDGSVRSKSSAAAIEHDLDMHFWSNVWHSFPHVRCPILFLRPTVGLLGTTGHVYSEEDASALIRLNSRCHRVDVGGGNHYTFVIQDYPPVTPHIQQFLKETVVENRTGKLV
jgi:pimeloyl-ACP methyl ester carboxylesterase